MDLDQYVKFTAALLFVIALIVAVAWLMRRMGLGGVTTAVTRHRRLTVVEVLPLDAKRRLLLIQRDDREHLILLSAYGDLLVESRARDDFRVTMTDASLRAAHDKPGAAP